MDYFDLVFWVQSEDRLSLFFRELLQKLFEEVFHWVPLRFISYRMIYSTALIRKPTFIFMINGCLKIEDISKI